MLALLGLLSALAAAGVVLDSALTRTDDEDDDGTGAAPGETPDTEDALTGTYERDLLDADDDDVAPGPGSPGDPFALTAGPATIPDYAPDEDSLVVLYDPAAHPDPQVSVTEGAVPGDAVILLDGQVLATVSGGAGLSANDILLVPQDSLAA